MGCLGILTVRTWYPGLGFEFRLWASDYDVPEEDVYHSTVTKQDAKTCSVALVKLCKSFWVDTPEENLSLDMISLIKMQRCAILTLVKLGSFFWSADMRAGN